MWTCFKDVMFSATSTGKRSVGWCPLTIGHFQNLTTRHSEKQCFQNVGSSYQFTILAFITSHFCTVFLVWELYPPPPQKKKTHGPSLHGWEGPNSTLSNFSSNEFWLDGVSRRGTFSKFTSSKLAPSNDAPVRSDLEKSEPPRSAWRSCRCKKNYLFLFFFRKRTSSQNWWMRIVRWFESTSKKSNDAYIKRWHTWIFQACKLCAFSPRKP